MNGVQKKPLQKWWLSTQAVYFAAYFMRLAIFAINLLICGTKYNVALTNVILLIK